MRRFMLRQWFGMVVVSSVLVLGCNHSQRQPARSSYRPTSVAMRPVYTQGTTYATAVAPVTPVTPAPQPVPVAEHVPESLPAAAPAPAPEKEMLPASFTSTVKEKPVQRRSYADITANPSFSHSEDYGRLIGELQYVHVRNTWRLRYASVDEEDRYGGSVTLVEAGSMSKFSSGQIVRVEGQVIDTDSREPSPAYRVRSIQQVP